MRLIDAEKCPFCGGAKVKESDERLDICRYEWNYCPVCGRFIGDKVVAKNETTTDVVRCKDCKHRDPEDHKCDSGALERVGCAFPVADDYFCSWGERREDADT